MALLTGPVFALFLFAFLAGGLIQISGLTPLFFDCTPPVDPKAAQACRNSPLFVLDSRVAFQTPFEGAKMLVWAFAAGFAEKLVPNVLDRFTGRVVEDKSLFRGAATAAEAATETAAAAGRPKDAVQ